MRREACIRSWFVLLATASTAAKDIPISSNYVIKRQDSCPDVGYYFRREPSPNAVDPGPCLLCFCRDPGTAACWVRDTKRCDVENYTHRDRRDIRKRRSPLGLGDIFFRDATRDFFNTQLPVQCKANEESFSDGCPPADWCIGCTVCDCDANGRWNCHILSFCNDEERKKQLKTKHMPVKTPKKPTKKNEKHLKSIKSTKKPVITTRNSKKLKPNNTSTIAKRPRATNKQTNKRQKKVVKRLIRRINNETRKHKGNSKPPQRKIIIRKRANNSQTIKQKREGLKHINSKKLTNKEIVNRNSTQTMNRGMINLSDKITPSTEYQLGQMLVSRVMSSVQRMVKSELEKINKTAIERGLISSTTNCNEIESLKKKEKSKQFKYKKIGEEFRWMRNKRDVGNESTTSAYDNGIRTTTDLDTGPSVELDNNIELTSSKPVLLTTAESKQITGKMSERHNFDSEVLPNNTAITDATAFRNNTVTKLKFQIIVDDNIENTTNQGSDNISTLLKPSHELNDHFLDKRPVMSNYKYNLDHEPIDNLIQIVTTVKPKEASSNDSKKETKSLKITNDTRKIKVHKKHNWIKRIVNKHYKNLSDIYFPTKEMVKKEFFERTILNNTAKPKNKFNFLKYIKKILNKLIYFGKRPKGSQGQDDEYQILKILCENVKSCKISKRNRKMLKNKIKKLNFETKTIFRTIKIIKGILHLINVPDLNNNITSFKSDIKKLNTVLKGHLEGQNLTETQKTQIAYLKSNTRTFILAVSRFTSLVNEVTNILQKNKQESFRTTRYAKKNMTESFEKIKKVLIKHNLIENTFIKKIYTMLTDLEQKVSNKTKVSDKRINSYVINKYSRDIIDNLRKLRNLAQTLNSSRRKRQITGEDDTMDYLLVLLEFLLKKEQVVDIEPVHDGIDVLIETIKNAPDIKDIKKKVLENYPPYQSVIQTVNFKASDENETGSLDSQQIPDSGSVSKENNISRLNDMLIELKNEALAMADVTEVLKPNPEEDELQSVKISPYNDQAPLQSLLRDEISQSISGNPNDDGTNNLKGILYKDVPQNINNHLFEDSVTPNFKGMVYKNMLGPQNKSPYEEVTQNKKGSLYEDATQIVRAIPYEDISQNVYYERIDENATNFDTLDNPPVATTARVKEKLGFEKFENAIDFGKKIESFSENDDSGYSGGTNSTRDTKQKLITTDGNNTVRYVDSNQSGDSVGNLEWIEENFGKELTSLKEKKVKSQESTTPVPSKSIVPTPTASPTQSVDLSDVSDEIIKKNEKKLSAEELMYRKQMDLLNSLDYGTEKTDFEDTKSEDDITDSIFA